MDVRLPKPLHGWRAFAGEVGVIVLGVLIALAAQELVQDLQWRSDVKETRQALDAELAHNLEFFSYDMSLRPCARSRLNELEFIVDRQKDGKTVRMKHDFSPALSENLRFAVWDSATGEAKSHMPLRVKLQYAMLYDIFLGYQRLREAEIHEWNELADLDLSTRLSGADAHNAKIAIKHLRFEESVLPGYASLLARSASPLHVRPYNDVDQTNRDLLAKNRSTFCSPLI
jgi:hypothetical protein